ncbi:hypothetical protein QMG61_03025 [Cryobacterium sp. PH31-AA6]|uniref:hypothetical protein n=1 Tax=Cryobacterium sp. PH31-AA6 TaxID=3046205 RepID=UPI0024BB9AB5|nr:hypothetical protein [Cryobacterium sp. PH31-AA6]MDJ0322736.1 hypothetical protein [Cryobacterium sp. PH31-AA6]
MLPYGDFYVWSDDDKKYPSIRIIFTDTDTEESNAVGDDGHPQGGRLRREIGLGDTIWLPDRDGGGGR